MRLKGFVSTVNPDDPEKLVFRGEGQNHKFIHVYDAYTASYGSVFPLEVGHMDMTDQARKVCTPDLKVCSEKFARSYSVPLTVTQDGGLKAANLNRALVRS